MVPIPNGTSIADTTLQYGNNSVFYNYTASDCTNYISGTIVIVFNQATGIAITTTPLVTLGSSAGLSFSATIVSSTVNLNITVPSPNWNLNLSKIVFVNLCEGVCPALITESGDDLITESGDTIIINCPPPPAYVSTENYDPLLTENGFNIIS